MVHLSNDFRAKPHPVRTPDWPIGQANAGRFWPLGAYLHRAPAQPGVRAGLMELTFAAAVLTHPIALLLLGLAIFGSAHLGGKAGRGNRGLSRARLLSGFAAVACTAVGMAAAASYISPSEASRLGISADKYWDAIWQQFTVFAVLITYFSLLGCAFISTPIIVQLAEHGLATVPIVVAVSVPVSLVLLVSLGFVSPSSPGKIAQELVWVGGVHAALAFAFSIGARLPVRRQGGRRQ